MSHVERVPAVVKVVEDAHVRITLSEQEAAGLHKLLYAGVECATVETLGLSKLLHQLTVSDLPSHQHSGYFDQPAILDRY